MVEKVQFSCSAEICCQLCLSGGRRADVHPAAQRATICGGLTFGRGTDQQPPALWQLAALAPCSPRPEHLELPSVTCVGHLWAVQHSMAELKNT